MVTLQTMIKHAPTLYPEAKFLTHLSELKARCSALAESKKNDELVVTLANEILAEITTLLSAAGGWAAKQRPPSPKASARASVSVSRASVSVSRMSVASTACTLTHHIPPSTHALPSCLTSLSR